MVSPWRVIGVFILSIKDYIHFDLLWKIYINNFKGCRGGSASHAIRLLRRLLIGELRSGSIEKDGAEYAEGGCESCYSVFSVVGCQ